MRALVPRALACAVMVWCTVAHADAIKHPTGFTFNLPNIGKSWEQEVKGDLIIASDESDTLPELRVFVFPPKQQGTLAEIQRRLATELPRPGVDLDGDAIKTVKVGDAKNETLGDASAVIGTLALNADKAAFAIVQRNGTSLILVAVPKAGIFDRGNANFRALLKGLQPAAVDVSKVVAEMMPEVAIVKEVTATSTYVDKKHKGAYDPANVIWHDTAEDASLGSVPRTAWCEGKPDEGIGETLTITFARPEKIDRIEIAAGVWLSEKLFNANNQITTLEVGIDGKTTTVKAPATREWLKVPVGRAVSAITLKIGGVKKGTMNDTCISAVDIRRDVGDAGFSVVSARDLGADAVAALPAALAKIQAALVDPSYVSLQPVLAFPFVYNYAGGPKKTKLASWQAVEAQCKATGKKRIDDPTSSKCPSGTFFTPPSRMNPVPGKLTLTPRAGNLVVEFPVEGGIYNRWSLVWKDGGWRLTAIDYIEQKQD